MTPTKPRVYRLSGSAPQAPVDIIRLALPALRYDRPANRERAARAILAALVEAGIVKEA